MVPAATETPPCNPCPAQWLRQLMIFIRLGSWGQTYQWPLCQGQGALHCAAKVHPCHYSSRGPALSDPVGGTGMGAGLPIPTPGLTIQSTVFFLPDMGGTVSPPMAFATCPIVSFAESQFPPLFSITVGSVEPPSLRLSTWLGPGIYDRP